MKLSSYKIAIEVPPRYPLEHFNYAVLLEKLDMITEAEEHYKKALEINPNFVEAHNNYANFLRQKMQLLEAEKEVYIALRIEPQNPYSLGILGDILADEGLDFIKSIEAYDEALKNSDAMKDSV